MSFILYFDQILRIIVLDDIYQYHLPPARRIPPLLWTRVRNDLPGYITDSEADGVRVINWYHRQFKDAANDRYFKVKGFFRKYFFCPIHINMAGSKLFAYLMTILLKL